MDAYLAFLRGEPRARAYLGASLIDDLGIAVSAWASALMMTNLAVTQRARASMMLPALGCFLVGSLVAGPLADWATRDLARYRWKVVLFGRAVETVVLGYLVIQLAGGHPTIGRVLPYVMVSAFMKTALRATRIAFSVDLLQAETDTELLDETGAPLRRKTHLLPLLSLVGFFSTLALLGGLIAGGEIMKWVHGRAHWLFGFDVLTNLGFVAVVAVACRPPRDLTRRAAPLGGKAFLKFWRSQVEGIRFLAAPAQRPLLALLAGAWIVEVITESFDGRMVIKHVLHGSDDAVRHAEIGWALVAAIGAALLPLLAKRTANIGKIFLLTMLLDGVVLMCAGRASAVLPFAAAIALDRSLTLTSGTLTEVAQNSISTAAMRGRIAGTYAVFVIVGDIGSEMLATAAETRWGIPGLIVRAGFLQIALVSMIAIAGGRRLWNFGLRADPSNRLLPAVS